MKRLTTIGVAETPFDSKDFSVISHAKKMRRNLGPATGPEHFGSEQEMVDRYISSQRRRGPRSRVILTEFESANGITDVLKIRLRPSWKRLTAIGNIPPQWAFALHQIPYRRNITVEHFAELTGASTRTASSILRMYSEHGFCRPGRRPLTWIKIKQPAALVSEIVSIEAKLRDWSRALVQAYRHLDYANTSWVLLDSRRAEPAVRRIEEFKRLNVGLLLLRPDGRVTRVFVPVHRTAKSLLRFWHVNSAIAKALLEMSSEVAV